MEKNNERRDNAIEVFHPSWLNYFGLFFLIVISIVIAVMFFINELQVWSYFFIFVAIIILLRAVFSRLTYTYTVTTSSVRSRIGIIAKHESEIRMSDIREIGIEQSIGQRVFGIGDVYFASAGTGGVEVVFEGVRAPSEIRDRVNEKRDSSETDEKKRCPQCGELIWIEARVCPHCNYQFEGK